MKKDKKIATKIPSAGMRPDKVRPDTGAALPNRDSLLEEIEWRKEHAQ